MSLLNDVLRDLHDRNQIPGTQDRPRTSPLMPARPRRRWSPWLVILALALGGTLFRSVLPTTQAPTLAPVSAPAEPEPPPAETELATLKGWDAELSEGTMQLRFQLSGPVEYRVARSENLVEVWLGATRLSKPLRESDLPDGPVDWIDARREGDDVSLRLGLRDMPGVHVRLHRRTESSELIVHLFSEPPAAIPDVSARPSDSVERAELRELKEHVQVKTAAQPVPAERAFQSALRLMRNGLTDAAEAQLRIALGADPAHDRARARLAHLLIERGSLARAGELLAEGRKLNPSRSDYAMLEARVLTELGSIEQAIAVLESFPLQASSDPEYGAFLAALLQKQGDHPRAARLYAQALGTDRRRGSWWLGLGISLDATANHAGALESYQQARNLGGLDPATLAWIERRVLELQVASR